MRHEGLPVPSPVRKEIASTIPPMSEITESFKIERPKTQTYNLIFSLWSWNTENLKTQPILYQKTLACYREYSTSCKGRRHCIVCIFRSTHSIFNKFVSESVADIGTLWSDQGPIKTKGYSGPQTHPNQITFYRTAVNVLRQLRLQTGKSKLWLRRDLFSRKMKHKVTLKGDTFSHLDFNLASQDIVFKCLDGQVWKKS